MSAPDVEPAAPAPGRPIRLRAALTPPPGVTQAQRRAAEAAVLGVMVVWASNFIVIKAALDALPPVGISTIRFGLAAVLLLVLLRWREGTIRLPARDFAGMAVVGVLGFGVYQLLWTTGLQSISAGDSALIIASTPVLTALLAVAAGSDTLTRRKLAGALVAFAGVAIVIGGGQGVALGASLAGDALTLGAALCWAIYTAYGAPILRRWSPLRTTAWAVVAGTLFMAPVGAAQLAAVDLGAVPPAAWAGLVYSGVLPVAISNVVVFHAVRLAGPTRITAFQFLVPAFAVVMAAVALGEPILLAQGVGGAVIVAGILLMRSTRWLSRGMPAARRAPT